MLRRPEDHRHHTVNIANVFYTGSKLIAYDETPAAVADNADLAGAVVRITARGN